LWRYDGDGWFSPKHVKKTELEKVFGRKKGEEPLPLEAAE
jgi:hypothetical protein